MVALGPGVLKIGGTDYSCLVTSLELTVSASTSESTFKLCGTEVPGVTDLTGEIAGTLDQDIDQAGGLFEYASKNAASVQTFEFTPSTSAGLAASGSLLLMPLSFGGDEYGSELTSDVTWSTVGNINYDRGGADGWVQIMGKVAAAIGGAATGATAGTPGSFTPAGATPPANLAAAASVTASPATAWSTGQYVVLGDASQAHWNGTAWIAGATP